MDGPLKSKDLIDKHIQEAYDVQYRYYCMMHAGYQKVDEEVKKLERLILKDQPSLEAFKEAVRYKQDAIAQWRKANFYYKSLKKSLKPMVSDGYQSRTT